MANSACAMIKAMGMLSENAHRMSNGEPPLYDEDSFDALQFEFNIDPDSL